MVRQWKCIYGGTQVITISTSPIDPLALPRQPLYLLPDLSHLWKACAFPKTQTQWSIIVGWAGCRNRQPRHARFLGETIY